ncbi:MAG: hypothetical protein IPN89_05720 [Saprospiraceae bacterium]|nr:hypothetical protein [Saprospiraceae bacterium]
MSFNIRFLICVTVSAFFSCTSTKKVVDSNEPKANFDINIPVQLAEVDNLGRIYVVDDKNRIINFKPDYNEQYRYANKKSGSVSSVDVTNPLRIVVFYDDFNQIKIFDNTLTVINELNLADKFADISAAGVTNDGNLWVFEPTQFKLLKIKDNGTVIYETSNVNDFGMSDVKINDIREKGNFVVLCDKSKGFYIFDNMGQYMHHFEASDIRSFQFDGRNVTYYTPTGLKNYSIKFKERQMLAFPITMQKEGLKFIIYNNGDLYEVNENGINVVKKDTK